MKHKRCVDPKDYEPENLRLLIESDEDAFQPGRRNNDMVNWFIANRLYEIQTPHPVPWISNQTSQYVRQLAEGLRHNVQIDSLNEWDIDWEWKMYVLCEHYGHYERPEDLYHLWIPMDYTVGQEIDGQLDLL